MRKLDPGEAGQVTYQWQYRKCGKPTCHCKTDGSQGHGPYLYGYYHQDGKLHSVYVGASRASEVEAKKKPA